MSSAAPPCVCLLIGPPATGKSFLAKRLVDRLQSREALLVQRVEFDAEYDALSEGLALDGTTFKFLRDRSQARIVNAIEGASVSSASAGCDVVVVDDIMYLRSMRRELYTLSRDHGSVLLCVNVSCPLEVARARNRAREEAQQEIRQPKIPDDVLERLHKEFEPLCEKCTSERYSLVIDNGINGEDDVEGSLDKIVTAIHNARAEFKAARVILDTPPKASHAGQNPSVMHMADILLRQHVGEVIRGWQATGRCKADIVKLAKKCKEETLQKLRVDNSTLTENESESRVLCDAVTLFQKSWEEVTKSLF
jgi:tRNA uridine 5-carbamoylmethylation protein Kti12